MNWQRHHGGECPCPADLPIYFGIKAGAKSRGILPDPIPAGKLRWNHRNDPGDIIWWSPA